MLYIMGFFRKNMYNKNKRAGKNIACPALATVKKNLTFFPGRNNLSVYLSRREVGIGFP
jgi:hypothetical protein